MNAQHIEAYADIPQPPRTSFGFLDDLKSPLEHVFTPGQGIAAADGAPELFARGFALRGELARVPETALASLRRFFQAKNIPESDLGYPIVFAEDNNLEHEEFTLDIAPEQTRIAAADDDGMRRAAYFLEDRAAQDEGNSLAFGHFRRKPFIKHRISRCFFGPTYRAPFYIDELTNDVDYYPEPYLDKLAHEGINGLWLTMYFRDLPSSIFPGRGKDAEKRFAKLRLTVERCARYGIRIYLFFSEPKLFGATSYAVPFEDAKEHPELVGITSPDGQFGWFCASTEAGQTYLRESVAQIFKAVPRLGGMINIMFGEDNGGCVNTMLYDERPGVCPRCSKREPADIYAQNARTMKDTMLQYAPDAEFIGWFYAPGQRDGTEFSARLARAVAAFPKDCTVMFNFESGGREEQLGKTRTVFDYSLAYPGPSELFRKVASGAGRAGAKLQVGCSHEDASVPFIPVPSNLFEKYKAMHELGVSAVMQCWYFGNYPGIMNKAAGELSFAPFPASEDEFLLELARPVWRKNAGKIAEAWKFFARGYREFPANIAFEWFGPLHQAIAWPLHLHPVDQAISPSWILTYFPKVSGDRVGECLAYHHTLAEGLELCERMDQLWNQGRAIMESLRSEYLHDRPRLGDIDLAAAIGLQIRSTRNMLAFYKLREDMLHFHTDKLAPMRAIAEEEIRNTQAMIELCERDSRLGYHSEAEGYLFFPAKLRARIELLHELLDEDFAAFDLNAPWIDAYTGKRPEGPAIRAALRGAAQHPEKIAGTEISWQAAHDAENLYFEIFGADGKDFSLEIEPCRLWPPMRFDFHADGTMTFYGQIVRELPVFDHDAAGEVKRVTVPFELFEGFRDARFPMRVNVRGRDFSWVPGKPWEPRLLERDYNPAMAGWLLLD